MSPPAHQPKQNVWILLVLSSSDKPIAASTSERKTPSSSLERRDVLLRITIKYLATNRHLPAPEGAVTKVALEIPVDDSGIAGVMGVTY